MTLTSTDTNKVVAQIAQLARDNQLALEAAIASGNERRVEHLTACAVIASEALALLKGRRAADKLRGLSPKQLAGRVHCAGMVADQLAFKGGVDNRAHLAKKAHVGLLWAILITTLLAG